VNGDTASSTTAVIDILEQAIARGSLDFTRTPGNTPGNTPRNEEPLVEESTSYRLHFSSRKTPMAKIKESGERIKESGERIKGLLLEADTLREQNQRVTRVMICYSKRVGELEEKVSILENNLTITKSHLAASNSILLDNAEHYIGPKKKIEELENQVAALEKQLKVAHTSISQESPVRLGGLDSLLTNSPPITLSPTDMQKSVEKSFKNVWRDTTLKNDIQKMVEETLATIDIQREVEIVTRSAKAEKKLREIVQSEMHSGETLPLINSYGTFTKQDSSTTLDLGEMPNLVEDHINHEIARLMDSAEMAETVDSLAVQVMEESVQQYSEVEPEEEISFPLTEDWFASDGYAEEANAEEEEEAEAEADEAEADANNTASNSSPAVEYSASSTRVETDTGSRVTTFVTFEIVDPKAAARAGAPLFSRSATVTAAAPPAVWDDNVESTEQEQQEQEQIPHTRTPPRPLPMHEVDEAMPSSLSRPAARPIPSSSPVLRSQPSRPQPQPQPQPQPHRRVLELQRALRDTAQERDMAMELATRHSARWSRMMMGIAADVTSIVVDSEGEGEGEDEIDMHASTVSSSSIAETVDADITSVGMNTFENVRAALRATTSPTIGGRRGGYETDEEEEEEEEVRTSWKDIVFGDGSDDEEEDNGDDKEEDNGDDEAVFDGDNAWLKKELATLDACPDFSKARPRTQQQQQQFAPCPKLGNIHQPPMPEQTAHP